jgi:hypothetical protein
MYSLSVPGHNLKVINNFLTEEELDFWSPLLRNPESWDRAHPIAGNGYFMSDKTGVHQEPYQSAYNQMLENICQALEEIYEEPLVIQNEPSFRRYSVGDKIGLHYDYARDPDGEILQLVDETRRPGEHAPYPAGLHDIQSVVYFNDDYAGGSVKFGEMEWISPPAGTLITWPSTRNYGHCVSEVTQGERYIATGFWIRAKTVALATHTNLLAPHWRDMFLWPEKVDRMLGLG